MSHWYQNETNNFLKYRALLGNERNITVAPPDLLLPPKHRGGSSYSPVPALMVAGALSLSCLTAVTPIPYSVPGLKPERAGIEGVSVHGIRLRTFV